jgi:ABC-type glycerol-3-phosphate transport system substrate-binding protein
LISKAASTSETDRSYGFLYSGWETLLTAGSGVQWADLTKDPPQAFFDSSEMIAALNWQLGLVKSNALLIQTNDNWMEIEEAVRSGQVAFWTTQAGQPQGWYFQMEEPKFKIGAAPLPLIEDLSETDSIYWSSTQGQFISSQAEDPKACWTWIKHLSEQPSGLMGIPARKSVVDSEAWRTLVGPEIADAYRAALSRAHTPTEVTTASQTGWPFYNWRSQALAAAFAGEDPEEVLKTAQHKADSYLACIDEVNISALSPVDLQSEVNVCARQADPDGDWPAE